MALSQTCLVRLRVREEPEKSANLAMAAGDSYHQSGLGSSATAMQESEFQSQGSSVAGLLNKVPQQSQQQSVNSLTKGSGTLALNLHSVKKDEGSWDSIKYQMYLPSL